MGAKIKSQKKKIPSASNKTQKNPGHAELPSHKSLFAELSLHASCIITSIKYSVDHIIEVLNTGNIR